MGPMGAIISNEGHIPGTRRVARGGGTWVNVPPPSWIKRNFLAPEFQTDDCLSTGVTCQTLQLKHTNERHAFQRRKMCTFNADFSKIFWGQSPQTWTGEGLRRPSPDSTPSALRRFAPPRLARDLWSLHLLVPPLQKSWLRACARTLVS